MSKPNRKKSFGARAARAWKKTFGSSSSAAASSSRPQSTNPPSPQLSQLSLSAAGRASDSNLPLPTGISPSTSSLPALSHHVSKISATPSVSGVTQKEPPSARGDKTTWRGLQAALGGLHKSAGLFPPLQSAIDGLISCVSTIQESTSNKKEYEAMAQELQALSESLREHLQASSSTRMSDSIVRTARSIQDQVDLIANKQSRGTGKRLLEVDRDQEIIMSCYNHIKALLRQLEARTSVYHLEAKLSIWSIVNEQLINTRLEGMSPVMLAAYNSILSTEIDRRGCTQNTRTQILSELHDWSADPNSPNVYWMNGLAGTGKTTIAYTFAAALEHRKQLAASFFCTRTNDECRDVNRIVPTIAYQLARYSIPFQTALCQSLEKDPDAGSRIISTQFLRLLKEPLLEVKAALPEGLVVVIDALDECKLSKGVEVVLDLLLQNASDLPLKFFVASRPAPNIRDKIETRPEGSRTVRALHDIEQSFVQADIELYLQEQLPSLAAPLVKQLTELSGSLFIFAATTARYIQAGEEIGDLNEHLDAVLSIKTGSDAQYIELDKLYTTVLKAADEKMLEKGAKARMRDVLWTVVCAREPVTIETLALLADINDSKKTHSMLRHLHSVLHSSGQGDTASILHASFADFILDQSRSGPFFCDVSQHNWLLTRQCFVSMKKHLSFNICGLESSHMLDQQVLNLKERVDKAIPPTLSYTCRYWGEHLEQACGSNGLYDHLDEFLASRLLFWMEAMNLRHKIKTGIQVIIAAKTWVTVNHPSSEVLKSAEDARQFITAFAANPVSQSTPHLYISALPLCYRRNTVYTHYWGRTRGLIEPKGAGMGDRYETILAVWKFDSVVRSIAHSPNGKYIAIGGGGGSLAIRDAYDGTSIEAPFEGHTKTILSVAFSHDNMLVVSGSEDCSVRMWNAQEGTLIGTPLLGHTDVVKAVAFSANGRWIASGSGDCTIRIWNIADGTLVNTPLQGHSHAVMSVAFSPDSKSVVSGSADCTVRIWDVLNHTLVGAVLEGHTKTVTTVVFSPDGRRVVSGSVDCSIRVWDVQNSTAVGTPFQGHTNWVTSLAFSPNGASIVSGSLDRTVRLWNAQDGVPIGVTLQGHTRGIWSVEFSPDGTRVVSGSMDSTIRTWNVQVGDPTGTLQGNRSMVMSVAFSPDGDLVASGGADGAVRVWNSQDGTLHSASLQVHSNYVRSVAFSPDGNRVVSGSDDRTICVWDVQKGFRIGDPLTGHDDYVLSIAVSPDGTRIASGSQDCTVRIWDLQKGTHIGTPLEGHSHRVTSVAFSPDGTRIISGSGDNTIRLWNATTGSLIHAPFEGHTSIVRSLAFSPDGTRIISGSDDNSIRVWNVHNGTLALPCFNSHTKGVLSVTCSFDGTHIASGSEDGTVHLTNMHTGTLVHSPLYGHNRPVESVAFSPRSMRLVSGSLDHSIRMWDAYGDKPAIEAWKTTDDGWVLGDNLQRLLWLPPDLVRCLPTPFNTWAIGPHGPIYVDYSKLFLGNNWQECYNGP